MHGTFWSSSEGRNLATRNSQEHEPLRQRLVAARRCSAGGRHPCERQDRLERRLLLSSWCLADRVGDRSCRRAHRAVARARWSAEAAQAEPDAHRLRHRGVGDHLRHCLVLRRQRLDPDPFARRSSSRAHRWPARCQRRDPHRSALHDGLPALRLCITRGGRTGCPRSFRRWCSPGSDSDRFHPGPAASVDRVGCFR